MTKKDQSTPGPTSSLFTEISGEHLEKLQHELPQEIEQRLRELKDRTSDFVQKNPLTSVAIAAGVGYLIAKLLSGRRS